MSRRGAYTFHLVAGTLTVLLLLFPIVGALSSPIDIFARPHPFLIGYCQYLLAAFIFYGFSSVVLRLVPLPVRWSVLYTAVGGLFFLWAFYPTASSPGMMRLTAGTMEDYLATQRLAQNMRMGAMFSFACIQTAYLLYVARTVRDRDVRGRIVGASGSP